MIEAALLPCAIITAYHGLINRGRLVEGETVCLIGAGGIGLHALQVARNCGAKVIVIDIKEANLTRAWELGADLCLNSLKADVFKVIKDFTRGKGCEMVVDIVGTQATINLSFKLLSRG